MSDMSEFCTELMHWLDGGRSPWHTVAMAEQALTRWSWARRLP